MKDYLVSLETTWAVSANTPEEAMDFITENGIYFTVDTDIDETGAYEHAVVIKVLDAETEQVLLVDE